MQTVSQSWKDNQNNTLVGESDIEISLKMTDPDAYEDASAESNGEVAFSDSNYIVSDGDKNIRPYATMERNQWILDGSREIVPDSNYGETGYVGSYFSNDDKYFDTNPIIDVSFTKVHNNILQGITIRWSEFLSEYAEEFIITAYNGNSVVATKTVIGNTDVLTIVEMDISGYNKISVEIIKWSMASRRARIDELYIGVYKIFSKKDVFSYEVSHTVDPISAELPKSEISFSIDNVEDVYDPYNAKGLSKYLMERQEINVRYGYKLSGMTEWIKGGKYYISEWDAAQDGLSADFKARDILEFMTGTYYRGLYNPNGTSLYDLAQDVLLDADLPINSDGSVKWVIDEKLKNIKTVAPLPIDTHANCLQMIANAGCCVLYQDREGILHIEKFDIDARTAEDYHISFFNSYSKSSLSLSKPLKQVDVPCYSYSVVETSSELYTGTISLNGTMDVYITYSGSASNVSVTVTGGTLNSAAYYTNACVLNITATSSVTVKVKGYTLNQSSVLITIPSGENGEAVSVDNPLITSQDVATNVGYWIERYMRNRMTIGSEWRADPRLDAIDVIYSENDYGENNMLMTNVKYKYNGAFRGSGEGRVI